MGEASGCLDTVVVHSHTMRRNSVIQVATASGLESGTDINFAQGRCIFCMRSVSLVENISTTEYCTDTLHRLGIAP